MSLTIPESGIIALVGPNGAGKSTLIRTWLGFERPSAGTATVRGIDPTADPAGALAQIGYVPQASALYRDLSVRDHLRFAAAFRPAFSTTDAVGRLERLRIGIDRKPRELSGGQQAQVALAIALAARAPILILDEPLASLDPVARRELMRALNESVRAAGGVAVLSSHVVADVEGVADRVIVLVDGQVRLDIDTAEALETHAIREGAADDVIGRIPSLTGDDQRLVRGRPRTVDERATLEDIVMGYLTGSTQRDAGHP